MVKEESIFSQFFEEVNCLAYNDTLEHVYEIMLKG